MLEELKKNIQRLIALYEREKAEKEKFRVALEESRQANDASRKRITTIPANSSTAGRFFFLPVFGAGGIFFPGFGLFKGSPSLIGC